MITKKTTVQDMNYKLEKFWNQKEKDDYFQLVDMNYKLEKFWNSIIPLIAN